MGKVDFKETKPNWNWKGELKMELLEKLEKAENESKNHYQYLDEKKDTVLLNLTVGELRKKDKDEILDYIRYRLSVGMKSTEYHKRFNMSGYEDLFNGIDREASYTGRCVLSNLEVLNTFADLGIYNYTDYLYLDFYKGIGTLYFRYLGHNEMNREEDFGGYGTTDIIYEIFLRTIFSNMVQRRRWN